MKISVDEALTEYFNYLDAIKGYSKNTILGYQKDIEEFMSFLMNEQVARDIFSIRKIFICSSIIYDYFFAYSNH